MFNSAVVTDPLSDVTARVYTIEVEGVNGTFNFTDKLVGSISGDVDLRPLSNPDTDIIIQPGDINIPNATVNALQTVFDIWCVLSLKIASGTEFSSCYIESTAGERLIILFFDSFSNLWTSNSA